MLNLQKARRRTEHASSGTQNISSVHFSRILGSIGESLGPTVIAGNEDSLDQDERELTAADEPPAGSRTSTALGSAEGLEV